MSRAALLVFAGLAAFLASADTPIAQGRPPNFIIIFTDDQGYGDLGSFGHPTIRTPNLDRMAAEGQRWTNFHSCDSVCTPSRAGLLTARLPVRSGMVNEQIIERPAQQSTLTKRYTDEAIAFIKRNRDRPFFLYVAHSMPHMPLFPSAEFEGKSLRGRYGDVIEEIDWNVGRLLDTLRQLQLDRQTLVVFTTDNGPWSVYDEQGGSAGGLRGAKGGTFEGGMRVPAIFWWPGSIHSGVVTDMGSTLDLLPTFRRIVGVEAPRDRELDGFALDTVLRGTGRSPRQTMIYYRGAEVYAVRHGSFKAHFLTKSEYGSDPVVAHQPPLLYNLDHDPSEKFDVANEHPEKVAEIERIAAAHKHAVKPAPTQLERRVANGQPR